MPEAKFRSFLFTVLVTLPLTFKVLKPISASMETTIEKVSDRFTSSPFAKVAPSEVVAEREMSRSGITAGVISFSLQA